MKRYRCAQYMLVLVGLLAVFAAQAGATALGNDAAPLAAATHLSAEHQVRTAWQKAQQIGIYRYNTTLVQTTWPLPKLENVGLSSRQEQIYLEGQANLPEEQLSLKLWSDGGNAHTGQDAVEIKVEQGAALGRVGQGDWQKVDDFTGLFAPNQDLLTYLVAAKNIREIAGGGADSQSAIRKYAFDVDGPSFAENMRDQMERELTRKGRALSKSFGPHSDQLQSG